jgi:tripartite-type tricarboxylate transporter receptor subunit TctC
MMLARWVLGSAIAMAHACAWAQAWQPQRNVELIASWVPGGSNDKTARMLEHLLAPPFFPIPKITRPDQPASW